MSRFRDRTEAGRLLAELLREYASRDDVVVLALPRGGVAVGYEVARALGVPLDVFPVRKVGIPGFEEHAMGAIAGDVILVDDGLVRSLGIEEHELMQAVATERRELRRREVAYRGGRELPSPEGKTVILVDDGLATGATMRAAALALRELRPARIVVAVPVASRRTCEELEGLADDVVCAVTPEPFHAVGLWYDDFSQLDDDDVRELLARAHTASEARA